MTSASSSGRFFSPQDRLRGRLEALITERDEIEDMKSREDQKLQVLLVKALFLAALSFRGFLFFSFLLIYVLNFIFSIYLFTFAF